MPRFVAGQLMGLLRRPMVIGLLLGMVVSLFRIPVPNVLQSPITILAGVTAPLGLVYIGGSMSGLKLKGHRAVAAQIVFGKLVLHPAAIAAVILVLPVLGIGQLDPSLVAPLILSGAMPMFGIYAILAAEKGHEGMASIAMLSATVASFVTLSVLLAILG